jgi:hypothetical protein
MKWIWPPPPKIIIMIILAYITKNINTSFKTLVWNNKQSEW